jgi:molybdate transport system substrate-binding protein
LEDFHAFFSALQGLDATMRRDATLSSVAAGMQQQFFPQRSAWTIFLFTTLACLFVSGCGGTDSKTPATGSRSIKIAAASDLQFALPKLVQAFERLHPDVAIETSFGSTGNFYTQLSQQAPFDLFLAADTQYPARLVEEGKAAADSLTPYARGQLALWWPGSTGDELQRIGIAALEDPKIQRIAIANPRHAPYGRAAREAIEQSKLLDKIESKLIVAENVSQAVQLVDTGAVDAGLVAWSILVGSGRSQLPTVLPLPTSLHAPLEQSGVVLSWAADLDAARNFLAFLTSEQGKSILKDNGFLTPGP